MYNSNSIVQDVAVNSNKISTNIPIPSSVFFPAELTEQVQWVCWKKTPTTKKSGEVVLKKRPISPLTGHSINITSLSHCTSFDVAVAGLSKWGADGIGFVFTPDDPFVFVDMDHVIDGQGHISSETARILDKLDSWAEVSQSGTGIHVIVRGNVPSNITHNGIEIYSHNRFVAMTGQYIPTTSPNVNEGTSALNWLHTRLSTKKGQRVLKTQKHTHAPELMAVTPQFNKLWDALMHIPPDCDYDDWYKVSIAIHSAFPNEAADIVIRWSGEHFHVHEDNPHRVMEQIFRSSKSKRVTLNSVFWIARNVYGWNNFFFDNGVLATTAQQSNVNTVTPNAESPNKNTNGFYIVKRSKRCTCGRCGYAGLLTIRENSYQACRILKGTVQSCEAVRHQRAWRITQQVCEESQTRKLTIQKLTYEDATKWKERNRKRKERSPFYSLNCVGYVSLISADPHGTDLPADPNCVYDIIFEKLAVLDPNRRSKGSKDWGGDFKGYRGMSKADTSPVVEQVVIMSKDNKDVMLHIQDALPHTTFVQKSDNNDITALSGIETSKTVKLCLEKCDWLTIKPIEKFPCKEDLIPEGGDVRYTGIDLLPPEKDRQQSAQLLSAIPI